MKTAKQINQSIRVFLKSYNNQQGRLQIILDDIFEAFNDPHGLNKNSTPLSNLLKELRPTDAGLVSRYIAHVSNAKVSLKANGNYVLQFEVGVTDLIMNDNYGKIHWYDFKKKGEEKKESYKDMKEANKALEKTINKAYKTVETRQDFMDMKAYVEELLSNLIAPAA